MSKNSKAEKERQLPDSPVAFSSTPAREKIKALCRDYQREIEFFKTKNGNGAYDVILHYLKAELERLTEIIAPKSPKKDEKE